ncbi:MAG: DNA-3-methyladenine glycosylase I [Candidatus Saccharimonadales bacterium]
MKRCAWVGKDPKMIEYHDTEWGVPTKNEQLLFEYIVLDSFQAGLSWQITLNKREGFYEAFENFDPVKIAEYKEAKVKELVNNPEIIRNRQKILATINNAQKVLEFAPGEFSKYIWSFVGGETMQNNFVLDKDIPAKTEESETMSKDMRGRGFKFVGPTICYAFMQATGLVNDHLVSCFRYKEVQS